MAVAKEFDAYRIGLDQLVQEYRASLHAIWNDRSRSPEIRIRQTAELNRRFAAMREQEIRAIRAQMRADAEARGS